MNAKQIISPKTNTADLQLAFDVGHSSIGWAVLQSSAGVPPAAKKTEDTLSINILGCGAVTYRADDCLASTRRAYRRQRRHIRSTRQRIARLKILLMQLGVLNEMQLNKPGCAWPWLLAARVLAGGKSLTWPELWDVLRWYAHNRGYDGNRRWSAAEADAQNEDSEKEANARSLMGKHNTQSMAETFCKELGIDPLGKTKSSMKRFKGLNAAFPREIVEGEVRRILKAHFGKIPSVDADFERALLGKDNQDKLAWQAIPCPELKLPNRYQGGLLFGQLVPRFDNRIISTCSISGGKVPSRDCPEFLNFRWAMQLANVQVARFGEQKLSPLTIEERVALDKQMRQHGSMTADQFKKAVRAATSAIRDNLDTMLMHPDAQEALLLDPVQKLTQSHDLKVLWPLLPERLQKRTRGKWRRGRSISFADLRQQLEELGGDTAAFDAELTRQLDTANTKGKKKDKSISREELLKKGFFVKKLGQHAAFARHLLKQAYAEVLAGKHPKEEGGCLFITEEIRQKQMNRAIAEQTNNHLVRHRLLILERLLGDIIKAKEFAAGDKERVGKIIIEVNRDLREMSGKDSVAKKAELKDKLGNIRAVEQFVLDRLPDSYHRQINGSYLRKARIADDLNWRCPYTGEMLQPIHLVTRIVDLDHIIPYSIRPSNALDSLVATFSAVNKMKGKRTAFQFMKEMAGKPVRFINEQGQEERIDGMPNICLMQFRDYKAFLEKLKIRGRGEHNQDAERRLRRKKLLELESYEQKEFLPRDLTQTSQLVRLGAQVLKRAFTGCKEQPTVVSLPGSVTGTVRKAWKVMGCLSLANPQVLDENGDIKNKTDIRNITHLHHALDACVLGLASHFIPNNGQVWELIVKRNPSDSEKRQLIALGVFGFSAENRFQMRDLDHRLKEQIRQRLAEKRVVQHIPARMDGLRVEQNTWRVVAVKDGEATLRQRIRAADGSRPLKETKEKVGKLLGLETGKLSANKGVLVIPDNFGVAIDPQPTVIPFHKVWTRLQELKKANGSKMPRLLRNGQIIQVTGGKNFKGVWRVFSAKNNATGMALDIGSPDAVRLKNKTDGHKINVRLATLIKDGMVVLKTPLTGIAVCPTTSSA